MRKIFLLYIALLILPLVSYGQEIVTGLYTNKAILGRKIKPSDNKGLAADTIELPFFDDFSGENILPSPSLWSDDFVFINNTYTDQQLTVGVATFDAINNTGRLYESASPWGFEADHLTSQPLNLDLNPAEEIWLSFYYQPGGLGDDPEPNDSLTLQFYAPLEDKWYSVWNVPGAPKHRFKPVMIRIGDSRYLKKGFRFRFTNWASLSANIQDPSMLGNCDHWNVDYIYLDKNRNEADTSMADVAFRTPTRSLLKTHEAMPWKQFSEISLQEMGSVIPIHYRNNDTIIRNVTRNFVIEDVYAKRDVYSFSAGATNVSPGTNIDYNANLIYTFNSLNTDSALFRITCYLITDDFDPKSNDTIHYYQVFNDYFAFDDGTSEGGYGINGQGSRNAMFACRFRSYIRDTIRAVQICFNDSYLNSNLRSFDLVIWDDNNGEPGNIIYTADDQMVVEGADINGFFTYRLPDPVMVDAVFYIGWRQHTETFLNAGYDVNTPNNGRQFYWLNGVWMPSQVEGSVMIRPVVGKALKPTSVEDPVSENNPAFRLWPNPASGFINLDSPDLALSRTAFVTITDLYGRKLMRVPYNERIDVSSLKPGVYILILSMNGRTTSYTRFIITR
jgi:hypothetical protein